MIVLMAHPQHGRTHAYEHEEVERLKKLGWEPEEPVATKPQAQEQAAVIIAGRKPGRPKKT